MNIKNAMMAVALMVSVSAHATNKPTNIPAGGQQASASQEQSQLQGQAQQQSASAGAVGVGVGMGVGYSSNDNTISNKNSVANTTNNKNNVDNNVSSNSGNNKLSTSSGANVSINSKSVYNEQAQASSAASVALQACQEGGSGQGFKGGISAVTDSAQCQSLRQAAVHHMLYVAAMEQGDVEGAEEHLRKFEKYIEKADNAVNVTHIPKTFGSILWSIMPVAALALIL